MNKDRTYKHDLQMKIYTFTSLDIIEGKKKREERKGEETRGRKERREGEERRQKKLRNTEQGRVGKRIQVVHQIDSGQEKRHMGYQ